MINANQLSTELRMMPDQALQRMAMMYKNDPYIFPMVISEDMARKKMRQAAQGQAAQPQPTVRDQAIMSMGEQPAPGIAALQAPNMESMADGGIVGYADGGEVSAGSEEDILARAQAAAREGQAYRDMQEYLKARGAMPDIEAGSLPSQMAAEFQTTILPVGAGTIKVNRSRLADRTRETLPATLTHELAHAVDRQISQQAAEQAGTPNQFTEAYRKLVGPDESRRADIARKLDPSWEQRNRSYRSSSRELAGHGMGAFVDNTAQAPGPRHVDATAATELAILMDLAQRHADKKPKGLEKILAFLRGIGYADGGDVVMSPGSTPSYQRTNMSPGMLDFAQRSEPVVRMAGGGVPGYAEGGSKGEDAFERAVNFVLGVEGDKYVENDAGKGPSKFGILQSANKDVNVKDLTRDQAKEIYRRSYWDAIGGDELAKRDPKLAMVMFDAAVNHGVGGAQQMLKRSGGDPNKLLQARSDFYDQLVSRNPNQYSQYAKGWDQRLDKLSAEIGTEAKPTRVAELSQDQLAKARAGVIPGGNLTVGGKRYTYEGQRMFEPREFTTGEKAIGAGETALSFLSAIPASVAGTATSLGRAVLRGEAPTEEQFARDVSRFTYGPRTAAGQEMTEEAAKGIASVLPPYIPAASAPSRAVAAARAARQAEQAAIEAAAARAGVQAPRLPPPGTARMTPQQIEAATAKVETPRLPAPGATPEQQQAGLAALQADRAAAAAARRNPTEVAAAEANAARLARQQAADMAAAEGAMGRAGTAAEEAARVGAQAARAAEKAEYARDVGRVGNVGALAATTQAGTADKKPIVPETPPTAVVPPNLTDKEQEKVVEAAKSAVKDPSKAEGWTNDDWLNFGFAMLANRSPFFMEALGMAGLKTLAAKQERAKLLEETEYRKAQMAKLKAETAYISETKAKSELYNRATRLAQAQINALKANPQSYGLTPEQVEEQSNAIIRKIYSQLLQQEGLAGETVAAAPAQGAIPSTPPPGAVKKIG